MQRVWVVVLSVWAMLAIVAVLAWSARPAPTATQLAPQQVVVKGQNGTRHLVVVQSTTHATTSSSATVGG